MVSYYCKPRVHKSFFTLSAVEFIFDRQKREYISSLDFSNDFFIYLSVCLFLCLCVIVCNNSFWYYVFLSIFWSLYFFMSVYFSYSTFISSLLEYIYIFSSFLLIRFMQFEYMTKCDTFFHYPQAFNNVVVVFLLHFQWLFLRCFIVTLLCLG